MSDPALVDLQGWLGALLRPSALAELAALLLGAGLAWLVAVLLARAAGQRNGPSILFGQRGIDGVLFPALWLMLALVARTLLSHWMPVAMFRIAIPALLALLAIRLGVKVLQVAYRETPLVRTLERSISWLAWVAMVLWVSGLLPVVLEELDQITWKLGDSRISVRTLIEGSLTAGAMLLLALWVSSAIEARLLRSASGAELSLRMAISNATRALLMFVGLLLALAAVGIDLTALSVLGGAIGVGVGFGLQKLAANYVSGFVILAERSMRIGDSVRVDNFEGRITQINARYAVIRATTGRESIVPNEMLMTSRVENLSLGDSRVAQTTLVTVGYDSDPDRVVALLREAALGPARVLREPEPAVALSNFGSDGLEFTVSYWIADPENGTLNVRSEINLGILRLLRREGIDIPYPQRVVHTRIHPAG
ncbi:MAG: mechanosensitive ion channel [Rhodoferax sp.]|nr:mechanosensitive ion channel [Rhodoferax sp.]